MSLLIGGLHHVSIRTTDLERAKRFYSETLEFQPVLETDGAVLLNANGILLGVLDAAPETSAEDHFDPFRVGLDHLALAVNNAESLHSSNGSWTLRACGTMESRTTR
jgi:glyoxylase I family protein